MTKKKILVSTLAATLLMTAFATSAFTKAGTQGSDAGNAKLVGNMFTQGLPILKEKKTYKIAVTKHPDSQNGFADKQCVIQTEKMTNVHIEWIDIPEAAWNEQVNIMLASGNLPDAFSGRDVDIMQNIDLFRPLSKDISKYCPNITEMLTKDKNVKKAITAPNKEIYSLPTDKANPSSNVGGLIWINGEWLKKLGKKVPTTTDEFEDVLRAFKKGDPNGNGKADEIPFVARQADRDNQCLDPLLGAFGASDNPDYVYSIDGKKVLFSGTQPGYYEGLKWLHKLYAEGLLDRETFSQTNAQVNAKAASPEMIVGSIMYFIPDSMDKRFTDYIPLEPLRGPKGFHRWNRNKQPIGNMQGFSITKQCKEPAVLLRYYDTLISNLDMVMNWQWGPENAGAWDRVGNEGHWTQTNKYLPKGMNLTQFKRTVCGSLFSPMYMWSKWANMEVPDDRNRKKRVANDKVLPSAVHVMPRGVYDSKKVSARNALFTDIDNYMQKFLATSVVNGINDAQWKEHLNKCKQLRTAEYTAMWQEYYNYAGK